MAGRSRANDGDDATPGPGQRPWFHPSELPGDPLDSTAGRPPSRRHAVAIPLTAGLAGALAAFGITTLAITPSTSVTAPTPSSTARPVLPAAIAPLGGPAGDISGVAQAAGPAILGVSAWAGPRVRYGSGVAYSADGLVVTVASLVEDATAVEVSDLDGRSAAAVVVGTDPEYDLALLRADLEGLSPLDFPAEPPSVGVGEACLLIGAGHAGQEGGWAERGMLASLGKVVAVEGHWMVDVLEIDARLDPAGVGGALLDEAGLLLGILTDAGERVGSGTLAVPARAARRSAEQLLSRGRVDHPWLGLATADAAQPVRGALVHAVDARGPAAAAGIEAGDVVVHVGGEEVQGMTDLMREVRRREVGEAVVLGLVRGDERLELTVTLAPRP